MPAPLQRGEPRAGNAACGGLALPPRELRVLAAPHDEGRNADTPQVRRDGGILPPEREARRDERAPPRARRPFLHVRPDPRVVRVARVEEDALAQELADAA